MDLKTKIDELLIQSKIDEAINLLTNSVIGTVHELHNTLIILKSRYMSNEMDNINKIISHEEYQRNKNIIISDFQNTLNLLPNEIQHHQLSDNKVSSVNTNAQAKNTNAKKWIIAGSIAVVLIIIIAISSTDSSDTKSDANTNINYTNVTIGITDLDSIPIENAQVEIIENNETYTTDANGECIVRLDLKREKPVNCKISREGFKTIFTDISPEYPGYYIKLENE